MKQFMIILALLLLKAPGTMAQTCEQREEKIKNSLNSFSAALLYNTYGLIGSIADGFGQDVYNSETAINLLDAQKKLMDNLVNVLDDLSKNNFLPEKDSIYASSASTILKGLKKQAELMQDYCNNKRQQKLNAYEEQRKKNWSAINSLMGVKQGD